MAENKSSMLPILIGGGVVLAVVAYLFLKKSAPTGPLRPGQVGPGGLVGPPPCKLPNGSDGVMSPIGVCMPAEAAALASQGAALATAFAPLAQR
jgi:hypothetical protein